MASSNRVPNPPPPPPKKPKVKLFIAEDQDLWGGWGIFEVKELDAFYSLGFSVKDVEVQGQKATGTYMVLVEELPHITLSEINSAMESGIIVQKLIEL